MAVTGGEIVAVAWHAVARDFMIGVQAADVFRMCYMHPGERSWRI
jgi:hypothetical protein